MQAAGKLQVIHGMAGIAAGLGPLRIGEGLRQQHLHIGEARICRLAAIELKDRDALSRQGLLVGADSEEVLRRLTTGKKRHYGQRHRRAAHQAPPRSPIQARICVARWRRPVGAVASSARLRKLCLAALKSPWRSASRPSISTAEGWKGWSGAASG